MIVGARTEVSDAIPVHLASHQLFPASPRTFWSSVVLSPIAIAIFKPAV